MNRRCLWMPLFLLLACVPLTGCNHTPEAAADEEAQPAKVEHLEGDEPTRVTLTEEAAKRIDIATANVESMAMHGTRRLVLPYAAILYDTNGDAWVYTNPEPLVFLRHRVVVDYIDDELVVLSDGPAPKTAVVTMGATELYGAELEFEEE